MKQYETREEWLREASNMLINGPWKEDLRPFKQPKEILFAAGHAAGKMKKAVLGSCCLEYATGVSHIYISPEHFDGDREGSMAALSTLCHELIHAYTPRSGHKGDFVKACKAVGLTAIGGKWRHAGVLPETPLGQICEDIVDQLGKIPHRRQIVDDAKKTQSTRMVKLYCEDTGYTVRVARKWLEEYPLPVCPCCKREFQREFKD